MDHNFVQDDQRIDDWIPEMVWNELETNDRSCLVDVRSKPEWTFVGVPDLSSIGRKVVFSEWVSYPEMEVNPSFIRQVSDEIESISPDTIFFICRSGVRSKAAARAFSSATEISEKTMRCMNVAEGFEGDLNRHLRRGHVNGWKYKNLPWRQT